MTSHPIRLLVVDDHPVVRSGIVGMLSGEEDLEVVAQAGHGAEACTLVEAAAQGGEPVDVVLMDLRMPVMDGVAATRTLMEAKDLPSRPRVVVLTTYDTDGDILRAVEAGATGYLLKDAPREEILAAVRAAARGQSALSPVVTTRLLAATRGRQTPSPAVSLSAREREVLAAVAQGRSNPQVGAALYITEATVKTHLLRIYHKLGVESRTAAVTEALRLGLIELG